MSIEEDLDPINIEQVWGEYGGLVCEECKEAMRPLGQKIADRLNEGKKPRLRDVIKLQQSLCPQCFGAIARKKGGAL